MKIVLLGSGNVATHLGSALHKAGHKITQVWSRDPGHAEELAITLNAKGITDIKQLDLYADLYILAVKDDAIPGVTAQLSFSDQLIVHTSGSTHIDALTEVSEKYGVIYPVQTFSKHKALDFQSVPVAVEGSDNATKSRLLDLARQISSKVFELDSVKRKALHVAAVFGCNFTNYLYTVSERILVTQGLDFDLLRPMISETAAKAQESSPADVQTGPAVRNDMETINKHLEFLESDPHLRDLYDRLSKGIMNSKP
jgi:predicted short-subunit dehydrogenase-like oxidoreductase (DUF2520 family)